MVYFRPPELAGMDICTLPGNLGYLIDDVVKFASLGLASMPKISLTYEQ